MKRLLTFLIAISINLAASAQIPNPGFEINTGQNTISNWGKAFLMSFTIDSLGNVLSDSVVIDSAFYFATADAHSGLQAMEMRNGWNYTTNSGYAGGAICSADSFAYSTFPVPLGVITRPVDFSFYYKYFPLNTDSAYAHMEVLDSNGTSIGEATMTFGGTTANYTLASTPIIYTSSDPASYVTINISTSIPGTPISLGTRLIIDDISIDALTGIHQYEPQANVQTYPNPASGRLKIDCQEDIISSVFITAEGKSIQFNGSSKEVDCSKLEKGIYLIHIITNTGTLIAKVILD